MKNTRKIIAVLAIIAFTALSLIGLSLTGCENDTTSDNGIIIGGGGGTPDLSGTITISPSAYVTTGTELTANYSGSEAVTYQWKNGAANVGTNSNKHTPSEAGSYTVTVSADGYNSKTSAAVTVTALLNLAGTVTISPSADVTTGTELTATYSGDEEVTLTYQWKNGADSVGANSNKHTPAEQGSYTVTVSAAGYNPKTSDPVTVTGDDLPDLAGTVAISPNTGVFVNTELTASYTDGSEPVTYQWKKDGANVGTNSNKYTPAEAGNYTVTAIANGFKEKTSDPVTVSPVAVTGVTLDIKTLNLGINETQTLTATVAPGNATNKNVTWSSSNAAVADVTGGAVTGKAAGTAVITVTTADGGKTDTCAVTVTAGPAAVTGVTLDRTTLNLFIDETQTLTATVAPGNADNTNITWSSSNAAVADVTGGAVTGKTAGTAVITVTTADGGKTDTCAVTVSPVAVTGVTLNYKTLNLSTDEEQTLTAAVAPANATNKNVTWTTSDDAVADVTGGAVTGKTAGTAVITVTTEDGGKTDTCAVTVHKIDFTGSVNDFYTWLNAQNNNTPETAYRVKLNITSTNEFPTLKAALNNNANSGKYVYLDLSGSTITSIPSEAFNTGSPSFTGYATLTGITIPDSVTQIGDYAFYSCTSLTSITIPDSITRIMSNPFSRWPRRVPATKIP